MTAWYVSVDSTSTLYLLEQISTPVKNKGTQTQVLAPRHSRGAPLLPPPLAGAGGIVHCHTFY